MFDDFGDSGDDSPDDEAEAELYAQSGSNTLAKRKKYRNLDINKLSIAYKFLLNVSDGLSND